MKFWGQFGEGSAALGAGLLYAWNARLPFAVEIGAWLVALIIALRLVEPARERPPMRENWKQVKRMTRHLAFEAPALRATVFALIVLGMASFVPVWTIQLYAVESGVARSWLGPIWACANYSVAIGALLSRPLGKRIGLSRLLLVCIALVAAGYAGLGLSHMLLGFVFYFLLTLTRGLFNPVMQHEEQRRIPSRDRAGFLSLRSLIFRSTFLVLGPMVGATIDARGQHEVMLGLGVLFSTLGLLAWLGLRRMGVLDQRGVSPSES